MNKQYYIKERLNPQFNKPYYIGCGQLTKAQVKAAENTVYGSNNMLPFETKEEYVAAIKELELKGFSVTGIGCDCSIEKYKLK